MVVFCDGDFWHGRNWAQRRKRLAAGANAGYWVAKIESNMARDGRVTATLRAEGWIVIRLWETDIAREPARAAAIVAAALARRERLTSASSRC